MAAQQNHTAAQLNLVYLFGLEITKHVTQDQIKSFYKQASENKEAMNNYMKKYPNRWKMIQKTMQQLSKKRTREEPEKEDPPRKKR